MNRKQKITIAATTAAVVLAGVVVVNRLSQTVEHKVYLPLVCNSETLKSAFGKHGIKFGFSVGSGSFENPITRRLIADNAAVVTTEVALKMEYTQPEQGVFDFSEGDAIVAYADELGIDVHGHTASWANQNPAWLVNGAFTQSQLTSILDNHINTLSQHYDGRLISMDTANEGYLTCGPWCPLGTNNYVRVSFEASQGETPLVYNSNFWDGSDYDKALALLDNGLADGVGIQLHLTSTEDWQGMLSRSGVFLNRVRNHGGWARFSEIGVLAGNDEEQAAIYAAVTALAVKHSDIVKDFIVWGIKDPAWRGNVTLFDSSGEPKAAYYAVINTLSK